MLYSAVFCFKEETAKHFLLNLLCILTTVLLIFQISLLVRVISPIMKKLRGGLFNQYLFMFASGPRLNIKIPFGKRHLKMKLSKIANMCTDFLNILRKLKKSQLFRLQYLLNRTSQIWVGQNEYFAFHLNSLIILKAALNFQE